MIKRAHSTHVAGKVKSAVDVDGIVGAGLTAQGVQAPANVGAKADIAANDTQKVELVEKVSGAAVAHDIALPVVGAATLAPAVIAPLAVADSAAAEPAPQAAEKESSGGTNYTPYIIGGVLIAGGVAAAVAAGGGGNNTPAPAPTPTPTPPPANTAPTFTSGATATVAENAPITTVVYDANATDAQNNTIVFSLSGADAALFNIDGATGIVTLRASADFEARSTFSINVVATDNGSPALSTTQAVAVTVTNVNEAPVFAAATRTVSIDENVPTTTTVLTAAATDPDAGTTLRYSLTGADAAAFAINATTGVVTFVASPDFEARPSFAFNVVATDNATPALSATQAITVNINNLPEPVALDGGTIPATTQQTFSAAGADVQFTESAAAGNISLITGFGVGDIITTNVATSSYSFSSVGTNLVVSFNNAGVVSQITLQNAVSANAFVFNEATAEQAVGFDFFRSSATGGNPAPTPTPTPSPTATTSLDAAGAPAVFNAATTATTFTESATAPNTSEINGFGRDDRIVVSNAGSALYSFTSIDNDLVITFNNGGIASRIVINDVVSPNAFIFDEASAEAAVGFNFFSYA